MLVVEAIEAWGRQNLDRLDADQRKQLGAIWTTINGGNPPEFHIESLSKEQGKQIMALFPVEHRANTAQWLNAVRKWSLTAEARAAAPIPNADASTAIPPHAQVTTAPSAATAPLRDAQPHGSPDMSTNKIAALIAVAALVLVGGYFAFFRDRSDTTLATTGTAAASQTDDAASQTDSAASTNDDFCALARQYEAQDPMLGVSVLDGATFFARVDQVWAGLAGAASGTAIAGDIAELRGQLQVMAALMAQHNYNFADPALAEAMTAFDSSGLDEASARVENYVITICRVSLGSAFNTGTGGSSGDTGFDADALETFDDLTEAEADALGAQVYAAMGISVEMAECLNRELGNIDAAQADAALLTKPVCGSTLLEVISAIGQG